MADGDGDSNSSNSIGGGSLGALGSGPVSAQGESDQDRPLTSEEVRRLAVQIMVYAIMIGWVVAVLGKTLLGLPQGFFNHVIIAFTLLGLLANRLLGVLPWPRDEFREDLLFLMIWAVAAILFPSLREGTALPAWLLGRDVWFSTVAAMSLAFGLLYHAGRRPPPRLRSPGRLAFGDTLIDMLFLAPVLLFSSASR